jgi:2-oxoglutarate ferredoxin oxidoreductase subunit alpha
MFVLGMLSAIYSLDLKLAREQVAFTFRSKSEEVVARNVQLLDAGYEWARENLDLCFYIPGSPTKKTQIVVNGNTALALGIMASGMDVCAMYPITPATSAAHYLSEIFEYVDGIVHQAEDEIAACAFAIGASSPGHHQRPARRAQHRTTHQGRAGRSSAGDLRRSRRFAKDRHGGGHHRGVLLPGDGGTQNCRDIQSARRASERCQFSHRSAAVRQAQAQERVVRGCLRPDHRRRRRATLLRRRFIPGQPGGMHTVTGLAHDRASKVAYDPELNQEGIRYRSLKLATFQKTLAAPAVYGGSSGDLLVVGWGSTKGVIEEAVDRARADGLSVSSLHLTYLQPMASGIGEIFEQFGQVMTVEMSWSDDLNDESISSDNRRYSNLAWLLRARYLVDVDCWSEVKGQPLKPGSVEKVMRRKLQGEGVGV